MPCGATYTSEGIMAAVETPWPVRWQQHAFAAPKFDIQVADGIPGCAQAVTQLVAEVTVSGKIAGIAVVEHAETPDIGGA